MDSEWQRYDLSLLYEPLPIEYRRGWEMTTERKLCAECPHDEHGETQCGVDLSPARISPADSRYCLCGARYDMRRYEAERLVSPEGKLLDALRSATDYMFDECAPQRTKG